MTRQRTSRRPRSHPRLRVHVLGGGKGESIVLEMPGGRWGVVDCYTRRLAEPEANPTLRFLRERGARDLEFLCLTHPHDDHYRGMSHLLGAMPVARFWRFGAWSKEQLTRILEEVYAEGELSEGPEEGSANELDLTFSLVGRRAARRELVVTALTDVKALYQARVGGGIRLTIHSFAPSTRRADAYQQSVLGHVLWRHDADARFDQEPPAPRHNEVSAGLLVRFGDT